MAITANEKVLTIDYWKAARNLEIGDIVFDRNGELCKIVSIQQYRSDQCYEVRFGDVNKITGDRHLGFPIEDETYRRKVRRYKGKRQFTASIRIKRIQDLLGQPLREVRDNRSSYSSPTTKALQLPAQDLPVPPFVFGFWFFNRKKKGHMIFPKGREEVITEKFKSYGYKIVPGWITPNGTRKFTTIPDIRSQLSRFDPGRIPANYLLASAEQRFEMLSGFIHSRVNWYQTRWKIFRVTAKGLALFRDITCLIESLGIVIYETKKSSTYGTYTVAFKTQHRILEEQVVKPIKVHADRRYLKKIKPIEPQLCVHIETDGADKTFLAGEGFIACL